MLNNLSKKQKIAGGVIFLLVVVAIIVYSRSKTQPIKLKVNLKDEQGNPIQYDPNPLVDQLNKVLTESCFACTDRCETVKKLLDLEPVQFMAVVQGYKTKFKTELVTDMKACWVTCDAVNGDNYFRMVYNRIDSLTPIIN